MERSGGFVQDGTDIANGDWIIWEVFRGFSLYLGKYSALAGKIDQVELCDMKDFAS